MLKNTFLTLLLLTMLAHLASAQNHDRYFSIGIVPTYYFDPITPSIGISIEHSLNKMFNVELMYGLDLNMKFLNWHKDPYSRHHEYKVRLLYLMKEEDKFNYFNYLALDFFGSFNKYQAYNNYYEERGVTFKYNRASIVRIVNGIRLNFGFKYQIISKLWIDFFVGAGVRQVCIQYDAIGVIEEEDELNNGLFKPIDYRAGTRYTLAYLTGIKVEYRFY